jgi:hypothetical protein
MKVEAECPRLNVHRRAQLRKHVHAQESLIDSERRSPLDNLTLVTSNSEAQPMVRARNALPILFITLTPGITRAIDPEPARVVDLGGGKR